ncbi:DUF1272 domain-containing protein [Cryobacterium soli]|jgi:hypothetical protein|uniref:DUF1272 domain-containing protein n=1 Tax=Cryobacterium soli TaxID=2220095 RepID=UPI000E76E30C|nr:DUF1272 domain-containing protein [Cryobacterium soli]
MLEMRPNCECCDRDLSPSGDDALICSFECTWCTDCVRTFADGACPNCGGVLTRRPSRAAHKLLSAPASTTRVVTPGCAAAVATAP